VATFEHQVGVAEVNDVNRRLAGAHHSLELYERVWPQKTTAPRLFDFSRVGNYVYSGVGAFNLGAASPWAL
jgi:hypothetical protein